MKDIWEYEKSVKGYLEWLKDLAVTDPELAKEIARKSLIETGVLNEDGSRKESIIDVPHNMAFFEEMPAKKR